ncbi:MAG: FHA domain-containing protein [Aphanocapsa sp. GSE-SYN-MK-11-07L]|jgi:pSer/pThr/pTyr-binding forkhead associated (FHA) protein|nr:FHA domain-containing protein [Aphanocapsa sp. GSE-SYN-MK-11-07L]
MSTSSRHLSSTDSEDIVDPPRKAPQLVIEFPSGNQHIYLKGNLIWKIGRKKQSNIVLPSKNVSRLHAVIELLPVGNFYSAYLSDAGSLNGSFLNGQRVLDRVCLLDGDVITLGDTVLMFRYPQQQGQKNLEGNSGLPSIAQKA